MDETVGKFSLKYQAVAAVVGRCCGRLRARRLRPGAYEYKSEGENRSRTYWVMTEYEAKRDGWGGE
jgi:hypothetical protein